jgi:Tfp pilus tip-associated adhesin PilY1
MNFLRKALCFTLSASIVWMPVRQAAAEDIDLFVGNTPGVAGNPNVLIIIDNSANWSSASQHWPDGRKQGQSELRALKTVIGEATDQINVGLMMFTEGQGSDINSTYVRYHVRQMTAANKAAFQEMIGADTGCKTGNQESDVPNNSLTGVKNCILEKYDDTEEKTGTSKTDYSAALFEAFKYLGGYTQPSKARLNQPGSPVDSTHFGTLRYGGSPQLAAVVNRMDRAAYTDDARSNYNPPIDSSNSCAKTYIIFIGNGFPVLDSPSSLLSGVNGSTTQLAMPQFNTGTTFQEEVVGVDTVCESVAACVTRAQTVAPAPDYSLHNCSGGTPGSGSPVTLGTDAACKSASQCATDAAIAFPGYENYACVGGVSGAESTVNLGTDTACKSVSQCATDAAAAHPGYSSYSCTGGSTNSASTVTLGTDPVCRPSSSGDSECATAAASLYPGYDSYSCSGGSTGSPCTGGKKSGRTISGTINACNSPSLRNQTKQGTTVDCTAPNLTGQTIQGSNSCLVNQNMNASRSVITVTPTGTSATPGSEARFADEWAKYLFTTDVNSAVGQQNVQIYTIDVFKDAQDARQTALLLSMAKYGGGKYFHASNEQAIINALRQIIIEIQSVNTVFAAASLPISATNRSQNENQVFIGMFRPDAGAKPRWYGNLKRYQIALFGSDAKLADANTPPQEAVSSTTGFIQPCAVSFWTSASGSYWDFSTDSGGTCTLVAGSTFSDSPDGPQVEKGGAAEVVRKGNNPPTTDATPTYALNRTTYTCTGACASLVSFDTTNVTQANVGAADATEHARIVSHTRGVDVSDENQKTGESATPGNTDTRPSLHGDVAHSRPLPINYGGSTGVILYYGANDGIFRAVRGADGKELWGFVAPEHFGALKRLHDNSPLIDYGYSPPPSPTPTKKDYFFDGTAGVYQTFNSDNTANTVWIFPTMRRGGRMVYAFDVSTPATPTLKWRKGCTDPSMTDTASCSTGFTQMGQSWAVPAVATVKGFTNGGGAEAGKDAPLVIMGAGYDTCEDTDSSSTTCSSPKGNRVFVLNADTGAIVRTFNTDRSVAADVTLVDRDFDQRADHAYVADTGGSIYRIDFIDPSTLASRAEADWTITKIAYTSGGGRKFLFPPAALPAGNKTFLTITSGDRERPLISNYPYVDDVRNRAYMLIDTYLTVGLPINLDDPDNLRIVTNDNSCSTTVPNGTAGSGNLGWRFTFGADFLGTRGEQGVTSSLIFGGLVFFSTNRPLPTAPGACDQNLGEAKGYAVNLLNGSGAVGVPGLCGGTRSAIFTGGGLPPSPVTGTVPVGGKPVTVMIGGINREGGASSPIGAQKVKPTITQIRSRIYWYRQGDKN